MKKRVKIIAAITSLCFCLSLLVVSVLAAQSVSFNVSSTLTFEATDVFVKAEGNLKQGLNADAATVQTENIPANANYEYVGYSYNRAGSGTDPDAPGGAPTNNFVNVSGASAASWEIGDINFSSDLPVVVYDFKFTNYSSFDVQADITVTQGSGLQTLVTNGDVVVAGETNTVYMLARDDSSDSDTATFRVIVQLKDFTSSFTASDVTLNMNVSFEKFTPVESSTYTNLTFTTSSTDKTASVSKKGTPTGAIAIPPKVLVGSSEEYTVTSIGDSAFQSCSSLTSVSLPNGVTSIGRDAFSGCSSLTSIEIPSEVTSIDYYTFSGCSSLTSIEIPSGVTSIASSAFDGCSSLQITVSEGNTTYSSDNGSLYNAAKTTLIRGAGGVSTVNILDTVTSIGSYAFSGCSSLTSIEIPSKVTSIGSYAFYGCSSLTSIEIPSGVTSIGLYAFDGCSSLTSISLPNGVTSIGGRAFSGCSSLTSIEIPSKVTSIGLYAFANCSSLTSIKIPSGVTSIDNSAFYNCRSLTSVTFGENSQLQSIGSSAFYGCSKLTSIDMSKITNWGSLSLGSSSFKTNASSTPTTITVASGLLSGTTVTSKFTSSVIGSSMASKIKLTDGATTLTWNGTSWA